MSWPDGNPRYVVDQHPTIRILDRAYAYRIVQEWRTARGGRKTLTGKAIALAFTLNTLDQAETHAEEPAA